MEFITKTPFQTKKLGKILANEILKSNFKDSIILALKGDLGGGKTTFLQGFAKGLGIKERILSPTFIILKKFQIPNSKFQYFYHFDCYRIKKSKEILRLGFKKIVSNPENIVAIEWADKIRKILPKNSLKINFKLLNKNTRKIKLKIND
jgi:tRNA threonylcarbamoyladenosine biosynthesis protein TsaE